MNDFFSPQISGAQGPVHGGEGPQNNYFSLRPDTKGRTPREQAADDVRKLDQRFVFPGGFGRARAILERHRTVFLHGRPGGGRTAAAKMLLCEQLPDAEVIHQLLLQEKERDHISPLDFDHVGDGDGAWLDLTDIGEWSWSELREEIPTLRHTVNKRAAFVVVLLPDQRKAFESEIADYCVQLDAPELKDVMRRYVKVEGLLQTGLLPDLDFLKENHSLRDVPGYVRLIAEAKHRAVGAGTFADWARSAYQALSGGEDAADKLVAELTQGPQRALLLATAMLHGAHADSVDKAATSLLHAASHPRDDACVLERQALGKRLTEIQAERDAAGAVHFKELGLDAAIRRYFWAHMPELRKDMRKWAETTLALRELGQPDRDSFARNFAELCLDDRYVETLISLVDKYTEEDDDRRLRAAAVALQCGLRSERCARTFRRQIYLWSRNDAIPESRAKVIVAACRDEIAATHPDEALVRIHHVARRSKNSGAREALVELVRDDRRFLRQMLDRLTRRSQDVRRWSVDTEIFLDIADPVMLTDPGTANHPLIAERMAQAQLVAGWSLAFGGLLYETWRLPVRAWLLHAAQHPAQRSELIDVLVTAGAQRPGALARIYAMTREQAFRDVISDLALDKITAAQTSSGGTHATEAAEGES